MDYFHVLELAMQEKLGRPLWLYENRKEPEQWPSPHGDQQDASEDISTGGMKFLVDNAATDTGRYLHKETQLFAFLQAIEEELAQYTDDGKLYVYSEHRRYGVMFRSHPDYRKKGPWRDWVMVSWGGVYGDLPAKIWGFIKLSKLDSGSKRRLRKELWGGVPLDNGTLGIVESTSWIEADKAYSIFREARLESAELSKDGSIKKRRFYLVDVDTFKEPVAVIANQGTKDRYFVMKSKSKWADQFVTWLQSPFERVPQEEDDEEGNS